MEPKKKRGRPKKVNPALEQAAKDIEFVAPATFDAEKLGKIDDEYCEKAAKAFYDPFKNPRFRDKNNLK